VRKSKKEHSQEQLFVIRLTLRKLSRVHSRCYTKILKMKRENPAIEICPGITRRTVAHGKTMYQMMATLAAGSTMPAHSHPQEQIVHILEGQMRLIVDGVPHELSTGDSFYLASDVPHGVETILPTRVLDTFSPPRNDYLSIDEKVRHGALYSLEVHSARPRRGEQSVVASYRCILKGDEALSCEPLLPIINKDFPTLYALKFQDAVLGPGIVFQFLSHFVFISSIQNQQ